MQVLNIKPKVVDYTKQGEELTGMEIVKFPSYMSPTSLVQYENNPNRFFLERMVVNPRPRDPQNMAMAAGSAFDFEVKKLLLDSGVIKVDMDDFKKRFLSGLFDADQKIFYADKDIYQAMFETCIEKQNRDEAAKVGKVLVYEYRKALASECSANHRMDFVDVERHHNYTLQAQGEDGSPIAVPLFGKLDAVVDYTEIDGSGNEHIHTVPFDWKVSGYGSASGKSPKPGYWECWNDGIPQGSHKDFYVGMPFDQIDEAWATQGCTYGWMMGMKIGKPFYFVLDMIAIRLTTVKVARYVGLITNEFQLLTAMRYINAWQDIRSLRILNRIGSSRAMCEVLANNENYWG